MKVMYVQIVISLTGGSLNMKLSIFHLGKLEDLILWMIV